MKSLRRLQDAQNPQSEQAKYVYPHLSLGPLGEVIHAQQRKVVLLDEIDKADIDFPNDLLDVLDTFSFQIDDLPQEEVAECEKQKGFGRTVTGSSELPPIVVIISNREKRLSEPFLRRCLYVRVKFPESVEALRDIVRMNTRLDPVDLADIVLNAAIVAFLQVRALAVGSTEKPPTTSELIDWVQILHWDGITAASLQASPYRPPSWGTLFKSMADLDAYDALSKTKQQAQ